LEYIKLYLQNLTIYDYVGLIWLVLVFFLLLVFGLYFLKSKPIFSLFTILFSFIFLIAGFFGVKYFLDTTIRKSVVHISKIKILRYSNSLIIEANITNKGKIPFKECIITIKTIKHSSNKIKDFIASLKPVRKESILLKRQILKNRSYKFKTMIDNMVYQKDFNTTAQSMCY